MHFSTVLLLTATASVSAAPQPSRMQDRQAVTSTGEFSATNSAFVSLIPQFGVQRGINPDNPNGNGNCDGFKADTKAIVPIPCNKCPPDRDAFVDVLSTYLNNGSSFDQPIKFNLDPAVQDAQSNKDRAFACLVSLQSFDMTVKGSGCPIVAAPNFAIQFASGVPSNEQFVPPPAARMAR